MIPTLPVFGHQTDEVFKLLKLPDQLLKTISQAIANRGDFAADPAVKVLF